MSNVIYKYLRIEETFSVVIKDGDGNVVESFGLDFKSSQLLSAVFMKPVVIDIAAGGVIDHKFARNFDYIIGIVVFSTSNKMKYQVYDNSGAPQFSGTVGAEYTLLSTSLSAAGAMFSNVNKEWYLRVTNQDSEPVTTTIFVIGTIY